MPDGDGENPSGSLLDAHHEEHKEHHEESGYETSSALSVLRRRPVPRQWWLEDGTSSLSLHPHEERAATPNDLVLDLAFVVLLSKLGSVFRDNLTCAVHTNLNDVGFGWLAARDFMALFAPVWFSWVHITGYLNRFDAEDTVHFALFVVNVLTAVAIALPLKSCGTALDERYGCDIFIWGIVAARTINMLCHVYASLSNPRYRRYIRVTIIYHGFVSIALWSTTGLVSEFGPALDASPFLFKLFWWSAWVVDFLQFFMFTPWFVKKLPKFHPAERIPMNLNLLVERHSLFIILSLGEVVVASIYPIANPQGGGSHGHVNSEDSQRIFASVCTVLLLGGLKALYFDLADPVTPTGVCSANGRHALKTSPLRGIAWTLMHLPLNMAIVIIGGILESYISHGLIINRSMWFFVLSLCSIVFITSIIQVLNQGTKRKRVRKEVRQLVRGGITLLMLLAPLFGWNVPEEVPPGHCIINSTEHGRLLSDDEESTHFVGLLLLEVFLLYTIVAADAYMRKDVRTPDCSDHPKVHNQAFQKTLTPSTSVELPNPSNKDTA